MADSYGKYLIFLRQMQKQFKVEHSRVDRRSFEARNELSHLKCHSVECPFCSLQPALRGKGFEPLTWQFILHQLGIRRCRYNVVLFL